MSTTAVLISLIVLAVTGGIAALVVAISKDKEARVASGGKRSAQRSRSQSLDALAGGELEDTGEDDITRVTVSLDLPDAEIDSLDDLPDDELDDEERARPVARTHRYVADEGADEETPTLASESFLVSATGQTDVGQRERNEDRFLVDDDLGVFFVADGMGGHKGGDVAAELAVNTIADAFHKRRFEAQVKTELPRRPRELAQAIQMANVAIWKKAEEEPRYQGMGTTLVGARFALLKRRVYIGHVGDSRCYRFRAGGIKQLTKDHTLSALGVEGPAGTQLVRAVGIRPKMDMDIITAEPRVDDVYLFCSDGLSKVVPEEEMTRVLREDERDLQQAATRLIELATQAGGRDNITVVLVGVRPAP